MTTCLLAGLKSSFRRPCARFVHGRLASRRTSSVKFSSNRPDPHEQQEIDSSEPLVLWLGGGDDSVSNSLGAAVNRMRELAVPLLLPPSVSFANVASKASAASVQDVVDIVNRHYDHDAGQQFVGGMGESDPGVWFAALTRTSQFDAMLYSYLIVESILRVKDERHGVPFALCTTGLFFPSAPLSELAECVDCLHVSLHASNPKEYQELAGIASLEEAKRAFGTVCSFITKAVEQGLPVEAWVRSPVAGPSRDLALSLGARHVHVA